MMLDAFRAILLALVPADALTEHSALVGMAQATGTPDAAMPMRPCAGLDRHRRRGRLCGRRLGRVGDGDQAGPRPRPLRPLSTAPSGLAGSDDAPTVHWRCGPATANPAVSSLSCALDQALARGGVD